MNERRDFIKKGAMLAGGMAVSSTLAADAFFKSQADVLKIGVIGTGSRGKGIMSLIDENPNIEVIACCDVLDFRLKEGLSIATRAKGYSDFQKMLQDKAIEAVIISTPFSTHDEIAVAALEAGKHVYCEKTMSKGITEIQNVINAYKKSTGLVFQTGHQYHSSPLYQEAVRIIQGGYIGEVTAVHCQWNRNGDWRRPVPDPQFERMVNWRMYKEYSGGLVAELMSHQIDFVNWFSGSVPARFAGFGGIDHWKDGRETYDNVHLLMEYPSGLDVSFSATTTNGFEDYQVKVLGSKATMILGYTTGKIYAEEKLQKELGIVDGVSGATKTAWSSGEGVKINAPANDPTSDALQQFYDAIKNKGTIISDIKTGANTAKCVQISLDALYSSQVKYWKDYPELVF